jgi:hypothetical protein
MTLEQFLSEYVTDKTVLAKNTAFVGSQRKIQHRLLKNGWAVPRQIITKLKSKLFRGATVTVLPDSDDFHAPGIIIELPKSKYTLHQGALRITNGR